jgi:zinc-binding alcohol dehydrogenase/oxidoreductase
VFLPVKLGQKRLERNKGMTMKAAILSGIDQPLVYQEAPDPQPGPDEAIVNVAAAALNHRDVWIQKGRYGGLKFPIILGSDGAGVVSAVGEGVDPAWVGQEVIIDPGMGWGDNPRAQSRDFRILGMPDDGTFAQRVKVPAANLHPKPQHLTWEGAAALPLAAVTAYRAFFTRAALHDDDRVLINGVGGGVALVALQFAVACGATVYATSSSDEKLARAVELGAAGGANYRQADWAKRLKEQVGGFDLIVDSAGGEGFDTLVDLAVPGGRIVTYGATLGIADRLDLRRVFWKQLDILGSTMGTADDFAAMVRFVESRHITPVVDQVYPLAEAEAAMQRMRAGEQCGKIVLTVGSQ